LRPDECYTEIVKEKFLLLEITPKGTTGWFLGVDEDRNIIFEKRERHADIGNFFKFLKSPFESISQKTWEGRHLMRSRRHVAAVASPEIATTIPIPLELARDGGDTSAGTTTTKRKITVAEVENLVAQAMQKIFNGCRAEAAKRLKIDELDTILVGARAEHFKVDGKVVASPVGFTGKKISLLLELTFTGRATFQSLKQFFNAPEDFFFVESPQAVLSTLSRVRKLPLNLIVAEGGDTSLYILENAKGEHAVLYREKLKWLFADSFKAIADALAVSDRTAKELYEIYRKGELSEEARRAFKKLLDPATEKLLLAVQSGKLQGAAYFDAPYAPPLDLPHKVPGGPTFEEQPMMELIAELGFSADVLASKAFKRAKNETRHMLLYFLAAYFDKSNATEINRKLRRRLHWLTQS
jgi:hypothetical protein